MNNQQRELATLGGGCFWCLEAVYEELVGVEDVQSGYAGGDVTEPSYEQVCSGTTGHAEVVQVTFDPGTISYREVLQVFFAIHDPTTLNRQGADVGTQYRSAIFHDSEEQRGVAEELVEELDNSDIWDGSIVTEIALLEKFYAAEDYHDRYYQRNSDQPYCQIVISPKVAKFRKQFQDKLRPGVAGART